MRDNLRDKSYFDEYIKNLYSRLERRYDKLKNNQIKEDRLQSVKKNMCFQYLSILKLKYCRGDNMFSEKVTSDFKAIPSLMNEYWRENNLNVLVYIDEEKSPVFLNQYTISSHIDFLTILSIGILIDISVGDFKLIVNFIDNDNIKDFLYEFLIREKIKDRKLIEQENFKEFSWYKDRFTFLKEIINIDDKKIAQEKLKYFLENEWYKTIEDTPGYNQHKIKNGNYLGYFCYVAAAIVKIKKLDASSFRDNQYYPKDLIKY